MALIVEPVRTAAHRLERARPGQLTRINGPVVEVEGLPGISIFDLVEVGHNRLPGEVTALRGEIGVVQVYDYAGGLRPGDPVVSQGMPLCANLGPGLLGGVFDGVLQPLLERPVMLEPGVPSPAIRTWDFAPAPVGGRVVPGQLLGTVIEGVGFEHRLLVPPGVEGSLEWIRPAGAVSSTDIVARIAGVEVGLLQPWPVRRPRPVRRRIHRAPPLVTGQRVVDLLYPIARGSTCGVPGGFGTGKTVLLQQIAKWCEADVIVYVGCGERGNEMAEVLREFSELEDPRTGRRLMERTVVIANTSNMPVMAREASIHTGVTVAEYFRDMGYEAIVIADSTSRWAEAMREFASRTGELPAEEGYPASLASAMAAFYERAGRVETLAGAEASVTIIASVSPPGGDMTEPVTAHTTRFIRSLWSLDRDLAYARHYPAIGWRDSFSRDAETLATWQREHGDPQWGARRTRALTILSEADRLESIAQLIGAAALPDRERAVIIAARLLREAVLQQSATSEADSHCAPPRQAALLEMVFGADDMFREAVARGVSISRLEEQDYSVLLRAREEGVAADARGPLDALERVRSLVQAMT